MRAMVLHKAHDRLVMDASRHLPALNVHQVLLRVRACGVCRTDLHIIDGELAEPKLPLVPGHEIIGVVEAVGAKVENICAGMRIGVPWLSWTCGECPYCRAGKENLCDRAMFTGYQIDGGYAEYAIADERYCFAIPECFSDQEAAPLMCAGLIGFRALKFAGDARRVGLYGFGAAAHIAAQVAHYLGQEVFAFTKPGDLRGQAFARTLGAKWAGGSDVRPPDLLDAALIFAPVGSLVPAALNATRKGGVVICAGIHMSDIPAFPYKILWGERVVRSVANLTRQDGQEFLTIAQRAKIYPTTSSFALDDANTALDRLRVGDIEGAAVLIP